MKTATLKDVFRTWRWRLGWWLVRGVCDHENRVEVFHNIPEGYVEYRCPDCNVRLFEDA